MNLSIPLFSTPLLLSAALIGLGFLAYVISARIGVVLMGAGSVIMGAVVIHDLPNGMGLPSLGLFGMQERATLLGGTLTIESAPGAGTTIFVAIPLTSEATHADR